MRLLSDIRPAQHRNPKERPKLIDGVTRRYRQSPPGLTKPRKLRSFPIPSLNTATGLSIEKPHTRLKRLVVTALLIMIAVLGVGALSRQPIGLIIVIGYGIFTVIRRIPSRTTFMITFIVFALIPLSLLVLGGRNVVTSALATYAFLLLGIGVMTAWKELQKPS